MAKTPCKVIALDDKQFRDGLQKKPDFALMLMSVMALRLRRSVAKLADAKKTAVAALEHTLAEILTD